MDTRIVKASDVGPLWIEATPGYEHTHGTLYFDAAGNRYEWHSFDRDGVLWVNPITA